MRPRAGAPALPSEEPGELPFVLNLRVALGLDPEALAASTLERFLSARRLESIGTGRQGLAIDVAYGAAVRTGASPGELVNALNLLEGVQSVTVRRSGPENE
jgi:hypothetical protein